MKRQSVVWIVAFILFLQGKVFAQDTASLIEPYPLGITDAKTTNLIFPYAIKSMDRGSQDVLVQKAIGVENVLQLKAATPNFPETNLTVVTADGSLYSYNLYYNQQPPVINIKMERAQVSPAGLAVFTPNGTNDVVRLNAEKIFNKTATVKRRGVSDYACGLTLKGLYAQDDMLYFQLEASNTSSLDYYIKLLRFFIKDRKKSKRTASQEIEIAPVYTSGQTDVIHNRSRQTVVVAVPIFTIPDKKVFLVQMQEANGGRNIQLRIRNKDLFNARMIL